MNENCVISIPKFGKVKVKVTYIQHGVSIFGIGLVEEQSRTRKQFFTTHKTSGGFTIGVIFTSYRAYEEFTRWIERYARWVSDPRSGGAPARVVVPSRLFDKTGILESGITYGDRVGAITYRMDLKFMGSRDPVDLRSTIDLSAFVAARDKDLVRLYPAGSSEGGINSFNEVGMVTRDDFRRGGVSPF